MKKKEDGIVRDLEGLGRLVIPKAIREHLNITEKDKVEFIIINDNEVIVRRYKKRCIFCGCEENTKVYKEKSICESCLNEIKLL